MENSGVSNEKFLVARGNQRSKEICGRMQFLLEKQKSHRTTSWEVDAQLNT